MIQIYLFSLKIIYLEKNLIISAIDSLTVSLISLLLSELSRLEVS